MSETDDEPIALPRRVYCELKTIQQLGLHEMQTEEVLDGLDEFDFETAREWVLENPEEYIRAINNGMKDVQD